MLNVEWLNQHEYQDVKTQVHSYHVYQRNIRQMYHMRESNYNSNKESNLLEMEMLGITMPSDQDFQFIEW